MADRHLHRQSSTASSRRDLDRRASTASSLRERRDVFSDDHGYDDDEDADGFMVADGFRPEPPTTNSTTTPQPPPPSHPHSTFTVTDYLPSHSPSGSTASTPRAQPISRNSTRRQPPPRPSEESKPAQRSSIAKNGIPGTAAAGAAPNDFSLRHDAEGTLQRTPSTRTEMSQRPNSMISMFSLPPAQSPYVGASGPSHPYGMYPQDTSLNRSSTVGSQRPAHPYGMYPQTTSDTDPLAASTDIATVGFPGLGLGHTYARRLGPDGEDADDLIGPDGHTEQLPPYTRYPNGNPQMKERYAPIPEAPSSSSPTSVTAVEDTTQAAPTSPQERLLTADNEANTEAADPERTRPKWARRSKKRLFGGRIPAWCIFILMFVLIALAATVGGVIGRSLAGLHGHGGDFHGDKSFQTPTSAADVIPTSYPTTIISITTALIDATPVPTPGNLPPLAQGQFNFKLNAPIQASSSCVSNAGEAGAGVWGCTDDGDMTWVVEPSDIGSTKVFLKGSPDDGRGPQYGPQPPTMPGPIGVSIMADLEQPNMGPAFFFQSAYTKQVILPQHSLNTTLSRRTINERIHEAFDPRSTLHQRDDHLNDGDNPWYCYWNNTLIEGFIYVSAGAGSPSASFPGTTPAPTARAVKRAPDDPGDHKSGHGGHGGGHRHQDMQESVNPAYPFPMKFEERRSPENAVKPFCQQMTVQDGCSVVPKLDNGKPITVTLDEADPDAQEQLAGGPFPNGPFPSGGPFPGGPYLGPNQPPQKRQAAHKRGTESKACLCQWMTGGAM